MQMERATYERVKEEAGTELTDLLMSPPGREMHSPWLGVTSSVRWLKYEHRWMAWRPGYDKNVLVCAC
jgi:hypothetical protein